MLGSLLIAWTIRLSLLLYAAVLIGECLGGDQPRWNRAARWLWTAACGLFVVHVGCALHFYHHWSHSHVLAHTAEQTLALVGWSFGEGAYFNYAFMALWVADVAWSWWRPDGHRNRPTIVRAGIHGYLFFIAFHGAIVFEDGLTRWFGIPLCLILLALLIWKAVCRAPTNPGLPATSAADPAESL